MRATTRPDARDPCGLRLHEAQRALGDRGQGVPLLGERDLVSQGQQRLLRALDLAVQGTHRGEQVVDRPRRRGVGLLESSTELVTHPRETLLGLGIVSEGLEFRA
jgi:hypothetical protein